MTFSDLPDTSREWKIYWAVEVKYGTVCPEGFLPAYSVDTEREAKQIMVMLPVAYDGKVYAKELFNEEGKHLAGDERINAFVQFGRRLEHIHKTIKKETNDEN